MEKKLTARQIAKFLWESDGKPDGHDCGEANRATYDREAVSVLAAIKALGFTVVAK